MSESLNWLPLYSGDYLKFTRGFTQEEKGYFIDVFTLLIDMDICPIKEQEKILRFFPSENNQMVSIIIQKLFDNGFLTYIKHLKVRQIDRKITLRENGKKGGRPKNQKAKQPEPKSDNNYKAYAFQGRVIKLSTEHYEQWKKSYSSLNLDAELQSLDDYYHANKVTDWFLRCSNSLAKKQRAVPSPEKPKIPERNKTRAEAYFPTGEKLDEFAGLTDEQCRKIIKQRDEEWRKKYESRNIN